MAPGVRVQHHTTGARRKREASLAKKPNKATVTDVDWAHVTDPDERRRIQNRIAQRKFREKARVNKERVERASRNQELAGNSYRIPLSVADTDGPTDSIGGAQSYDLGQEKELSGLPWGGVNLALVVSRGHEAESRRSSSRGTHGGDEPLEAASSPQHASTPVSTAMPNALHSSHQHLPAYYAHFDQAVSAYGGDQDGLHDSLGDISGIYSTMTSYPPSKYVLPL